MSEPQLDRNTCGKLTLCVIVHVLVAGLCIHYPFFNYSHIQQDAAAHFARLMFDEQTWSLPLVATH